MLSISVIAPLLKPTYRATERFVLQKKRGVVGAEVAPFEVEPAVDKQRLSGDISRQIRQQEQNGSRLLLGPPAPPNRDSLAITVWVVVDMVRDSSVSVTPGATALTRMLSSASSTAILQVIAATADFAVP